jgi:Leucine-rich repeat (LRR) protein
MKKLLSLSFVMFVVLSFQVKANPTTEPVLQESLDQNENVLDDLEKEKRVDAFMEKVLSKYEIVNTNCVFLYKTVSSGMIKKIKKKLLKGKFTEFDFLGGFIIVDYLEEFCDSITWIEELNLNMYSLKTLPRNIGNLKCLKFFYLANNDLESLPESIGNLDKLENINLDHNKNLKFIPKSFLNLIEKSLKVVKLRNTNLKKTGETERFDDTIGYDDLKLKLIESPRYHNWFYREDYTKEHPSVMEWHIYYGDAFISHGGGYLDY